MAERPDIVFAHGTGFEMEVYGMRSDGENVTQITHRLGVDGEPTLSPDRCSVAYKADVGGHYGGLYAIGVDGNNRRTLAADEDFALEQPDWSPDGERIVAQQLTVSGRGLVVIDAAGGDPEPLDIDGSENGDTFLASEPTWAPDGQQIAFAGAPVVEEGARIFTDVYAVETNGDGLRQVTNTTLNIEHQLSWSPDGRWIAYTDLNRRPPATRGGGQHGARGVFVSRSDGSETERLTAEVDDWPLWLSASEEVLFLRDEGQVPVPGSQGRVTIAQRSLQAIPLEGGRPRLVSRPPTPILNPDSAAGGVTDR